MIQYYIFTNHTQKGPFGLDEIIKQIKADTLVWHEGLPGWQKAETLPEIKSALPAVPPPVKNTLSYPPPVSPGEEYQYFGAEPERGAGIRKIMIFILIGLMLFVGVVVFTNYYTGQTLQNPKMESEFSEQNSIATEKRIKEINEQLHAAYAGLEQAKRQLHDATAFNILRSNRKRHAEVSIAENVVQSWEKKIKVLETEMKEINPWWVK